MVIPLFKARAPLDAAEELVVNSVLPLTIPEMLAEARARYGGSVVYQQRLEGKSA